MYEKEFHIELWNPVSTLLRLCFEIPTFAANLNKALCIVAKI